MAPLMIGHWVSDTRTIDYENDTIPGDIVFDDFVTENLQVFHNPSSQWYYLPDQKDSEVLVFKSADSEEGPHSGMFFL